MDITFKLLQLGHLRMDIIMFIFAGIVVYFSDYRLIRDDPSSTREATWVKWAIRVFIIGGVFVLGLYQFFVLFV